MNSDCFPPKIPCFSSGKRKAGNTFRTTDDEHNRIPSWLPGTRYVNGFISCQYFLIVG